MILRFVNRAKQEKTNRISRMETIFNITGKPFCSCEILNLFRYRNSNKFTDYRVDLMKKEWIQGLDILDIGCNSGHLTLLIAR